MNSFSPWALTWLAAGLCAPTSAQSVPQPKPMPTLSVRVHDQTWLRARRLPHGSELRVERADQVCVVLVPYEPVTAATPLGEDVVLTGVLPDGVGEYRSMTRSGVRWELAPHGVAIPGSHAIRVSFADGLLAMLLADGRVVAAPCSGVADLPAWAEFDLVGHVTPELVRMGALAGFHVVHSRRIEVYGHPAHRPAFEASPSGEWQFVTSSVRSRRILQVEKPARIGGVIRYHSTASGPILFEEEGSVSRSVLTDGSHPASGQLPTSLSATLRADRRYRLRADDVVGAWFHPAAIAGAVRQVAGLELQECRVWEAGVRAERGAVPFRTTLAVSQDFTFDRVLKVALLAATAEPEPPLAARNGHTWLVPDRVLAAEKELSAGRRAHVLAVAVPLPADRRAPKKWIHFQFVVLATDGAVLGATGVRSVAVLPDRGDHTLAQEQAGRAAADAYWAAHEVTEGKPLWEQIVNR